MKKMNEPDGVSRMSRLWKRGVFCLLTLFLWTLQIDLRAQVAGDLDQVQHHITFNTQFNDYVVDPTPFIGSGTRRELVNTYPSNGNGALGVTASEVGLQIIVAILEEQGINVPSDVIDVVNYVVNGVGEFSNVQIQPSFGMQFSCEYGGYIEVNDIGNADLDVNYPVHVTIDYPAPNTIGCGHTFNITTSYTVDPAANLGVRPPFTELEIGPFLRNIELGVAVGIVASFCVGLQLPEIGCAGYEYDTGNDLLLEFSFQEILDAMGIDVTIPTEIDLPPLQVFCEESFAPGADLATLLTCNTSNGYATTVFSLLNDLIEAINNDGYNLGFTSFEENHISIFTPDIPTGLPNIPEVAGDFFKIPDGFLTSTWEDNGKTLKSEGEKQGLGSLEVDLISLLELGGIPTGLSLGGDVFSIDLGDIAPRFVIDQELSFEFKPVVHLTVDLGVQMNYQVIDPVLGVVQTGSAQIIDLIAGQTISATYPQDLSDPTTVTGVYNLDGDFKSEMSQRDFYELRVAALEVTVAGAEVFEGFNETFGKTEIDPANSPLMLVDHTQNLTGFETLPLDPFVIDPEYPIIDVTNVSVEDVVNLGGGERAVVYKVSIRNGGDVRLFDVETIFDLGQSYATAEGLVVDCITSDDLILNFDYDGITETNLLAAGNVLQVGQESTIEILMRVVPEVSAVLPGGCFGSVDYTASAKAYGVSPIGTAVESNVYHCTGEVTAPDIVASVDLGASVIDQLSDYTVYSTTRSLFAKTSATCKGNVGSTNEVRFENASLVTSETATIVGDIHAGVTLKLVGTYNVVADYIQVGDSLILNGSASLNPIGALSFPSDCVATQVIPAVNFPSVPGNVQVNVGNNQTRILLPGNFKKITLNTNSILKMRSGVYNIDTWTFGGNNARVLFDLTNGPIVINVDKWQPQNRSGLKFIIENNSGKVEQITYNCKGNQSAFFEGAHVQGIINAPSATISFGGNSKLEGRVYANIVRFDRQSFYTDPSYLEPINISPACLAANGANRSLEIATESEELIHTNIDRLSVFPNPFREEARVEMNLNESAVVSITVFDMMGRVAMQFPSSYLTEGSQQLLLNTEALPAGTYVMSIAVNEDVITQMIVKTP
jgi:hypothetical protein